MGGKGPLELCQRSAAFDGEGAGAAGPAPGLGRAGSGHETWRWEAKIDDAKREGAQSEEELLLRIGTDALKRGSGRSCQTARNIDMSSRRKVIHGIHLPNKIWNIFKETLEEERTYTVKLTSSASGPADNEAAPKSPFTRKKRLKPEGTRDGAFS